MAAIERQQSDYISRARRAATTLLEVDAELAALRVLGAYEDYGSTLDTFEGENEGLTAAEVAAVVFTTGEALHSLLAAGHGTNLARLRS